MIAIYLNNSNNYIFITIECTNQFVEVQYNSATSIITCTFLNQSDTSLKSCIIRYGSCDQQQRKTVQGNSSSSKITLSLESQNSFRYTAIARNGTFAVAVQGSIIVGMYVYVYNKNHYY